MRGRTLRYGSKNEGDFINERKVVCETREEVRSKVRFSINVSKHFINRHLPDITPFGRTYTAATMGMLTILLHVFADNAS